MDDKITKADRITAEANDYYADNRNELEYLSGEVKKFFDDRYINEKDSCNINGCAKQPHFSSDDFVIYWEEHKSKAEVEVIDIEERVSEFQQEIGSTFK